MLRFIVQGLLLGLAYVAPIGTQNLYVINTAASGNKTTTYTVALVTVFFDVSLAVCCFLGIGVLIDRFLVVKQAILLLGGVIVAGIGIHLIRSVAKARNDQKVAHSLRKIIATCFAVTWLNPQAIVDGSLMLGGFKASLPGDASLYFLFGVCLASFLWFVSLATIILKFQDKFDQISGWMNRVCGAILVFYGCRLLYSFVALLMQRR